MDKIALIKAEIERLYNDKSYSEDRWDMGYDCACEDIMSFLSTLSEEPDKSLEEEMDKFIETFGWGKTKHLAEKELISATARHFAKWGARHAPLPEDTVLFNKGIAEGKRLMLEEAVECSVYAGKEGDKWIVSYIGNYESMLKTCKNGDKVRIIIVNE